MHISRFLTRNSHGPRKVAALKGVEGQAAEVIGLAPSIARPRSRWNFAAVLRNVAVKAVCLSMLFGQVGPAAAQVMNVAAPPPTAIVATVNPGQNVNAKQVVIDGVIRGNQITAAMANNRFSGDDFDSYTAVGDQAVSRGFIRTTAEALPGGARINVKSFHSDKNDKVTLWLNGEVLDRSTNQLRTITLSTLEDKAVLNKDSYRGNLYYDISYDQLNQWLKSQNPNLEAVPGRTSLGVTALWETGHQAGGFGRGGKFMLPASGASGVAATSPTTAASPAAVAIEANTPLHLQVDYPPELVQLVPQLPSDGHILSLLETEIKGVPITAAALHAAKKKMYELSALAKAGKTAEVEAFLGAGWTVEPRSRYWIKDDGKANLPGQAGTGQFKGYRVGADGLPLQDPMIDFYMDNKHLAVTHIKGANRARINSQGVVLNLKIGWNVSEPSTSILPSVLTRLEYIMMMNPGTTPEQAGEAVRIMSNGTWGSSVLNLPQREFRNLDGSITLSDAMGPWLHLTQDRHKFTVKNAAGLEIEYSFDVVKGKTLRPEHANRDGSPRVVDFFVAEAELDHLEFQNKQRGQTTTNVVTNATNYAAVNGGSVLAPGSVQVGSFMSSPEQSEWLAQAQNVTMDIDPRLHTLKDLKTNDIPLSTSHAMFKENMSFMLPKLFPDGLTDGAQKAAESGHRMGLVFWADSEIMPVVEREFKELGYKWTPKLAGEFEALLADPAKKVQLERAVASGSTQNMVRFLNETIGKSDRDLDVDVAEMTGRLRDRLHELGFKSTPQVDSLFARIDRKNLKPAVIERLFEDMAGAKDDQILAQWATTLGVSPVPQPQADASLLLGEDTGFGLRLRNAISGGQIEPKQTQEIEGFLANVMAAGKTSQLELRNAILSLSSDPETQLKRLGDQAGLQAPVLRTTGGHLAAAANSSLNRHYYRLNVELMKFFGEVAKRMTRQGALSWARSLDKVPAEIAQQAAALGLPAPKLVIDFDRIDATMQSNLRQGHIVYSAALKDFVHQAVNKGVSAYSLQSAAGSLSYNQQSLGETLRSAGVNLMGLTLPTIEYDRASTVGGVLSSLQSYVPFLGSRAEIDQFVADCFKKGLSPSQTINWASASISTGPQWAGGNLGSVDKSTLPKLKLDLNKVSAEWKQQFGSNWTAARERYALAALQKALTKSDFYLGQVYQQSSGAPYSSYTYDQVLLTLQQHSGIARPSGV
ncbi:MAG: hypothetical protein IT384_26980 [Deltaproteobacteria bacterium]|nr:hypothetical protein [Deltaproteobacteria bacterium]